MSFFSDLGKNAKQIGLSYVQTDPGLRTGAPGEVDVRNAFPFANVFFSFVGRGTSGGVNSSVALPAFLTNLSDSFTNTFSTANAYGRTDPIAIYDRTSRSISMSFSIPSYDSSDANIKNKKVNELAKNLYPTYEKVGRKNLVTGQQNRLLSKSPLLRIKFANLITGKGGTGLLGYITSFSVNHDVQNGFFMESGIINQPNLYTKFITLSITFQPLHEQQLGYTVGSDGTEQWEGDPSFPYQNSLSLEEGFLKTLNAAGATSSSDAKIAESSILNLG